jgi:hypothetical protein
MCPKRTLLNSTRGCKHPNGLPTTTTGLPVATKWLCTAEGTACHCMWRVCFRICGLIGSVMQANMSTEAHGSWDGTLLARDQPTVHGCWLWLSKHAATCGNASPLEMYLYKGVTTQCST